MSSENQPKKNGRPTITLTKRDLLVKLELANKGINPIDMIKAIHDYALNAFIEGRGYGEMSDSGTHYLAVALKAAHRLSEFYAPTIGPIKAEEAIHMDKATDISQVTSLDADRIRKAILADPFAGADLKQQEQTVPTLPMGKVEVKE